MKTDTHSSFVPRCQNLPLETDPDTFGELQPSIFRPGEEENLRQRMEEDGYLYLPGFFEREDVLAARRNVVERLAEEGLLEPGTDPMDAVARTGTETNFRPDLTKENEPLHAILYQGRLMEFYRAFFGEDVLHYSYTWFRAIKPGTGTKPHCDVVYMGRGTRDRLYTAWVPTGDVSMDIGGLMLLEGSHRKQDRLRAYLERDVDTYCTNGRHAADIKAGRKQWEWDGTLSSNPVNLRKRLGGRWLTASFKAGDLLTFTMRTIHASLDNQSGSFRFSSDSRYQPASEPADERWIGEEPIGHTLAGKRGRIC